VSEPKVESIQYDTKAVALSNEIKRKADMSIPGMVKDKNLILELQASYSKEETIAIAIQRQDSIKNYLSSRGISKDRIKLGTPAKSLTKGDVAFKFFSTSKKVLENRFNEKAPLTLEIKDGAFQKGENPHVDNVTWAPGNYTSEKDGRVYYIVIHKVEAARFKTFEEARGLTISDYQNYLEKQWIEELRKKYPPVSYEEEINKLVKP
jgi:peptidyl-prolyl cis-trans isomerase SurA